MLLTLLAPQASAQTFILTADAGTFTLAGQDATLLVNRRLQADAGSFTLNGQDATLTYTPISGAFVLSADPGAFTFTGQSANLILIGSSVTLAGVSGAQVNTLFPVNGVSEMPFGVHRRTA